MDNLFGTCFPYFDKVLKLASCISWQQRCCRATVVAFNNIKKSNFPKTFLNLVNLPKILLNLVKFQKIFSNLVKPQKSKKKEIYERRSEANVDRWANILNGKGGREPLDALSRVTSAIVRSEDAGDWLCWSDCYGGPGLDWCRPSVAVLIVTESIEGSGDWRCRSDCCGRPSLEWCPSVAALAVMSVDGSGDWRSRPDRCSGPSLEWC